MFINLFKISKSGHLVYPQLRSIVKKTILWVRSVYFFDFDIFMTRSVYCFDFDVLMAARRGEVACKISKKMSQKALNRVLTLESSGGGDLLQSPLKIMDLQNKNISVVTKH